MRLHNEELHNLYSSSGVIRVIKSRRMRWMGHRARNTRNVYKILSGKPERKKKSRSGYLRVRDCIQHFPDWPPGARTSNGTALCH
jgi:hypothetical protein